MRRQERQRADAVKLNPLGVSFPVFAVFRMILEPLVEQEPAGAFHTVAADRGRALRYDRQQKFFGEYQFVNIFGKIDKACRSDAFDISAIRDQMLWLAILYSAFIVMTSSFITLYYRKKGRFDWEVYRNTVVHNRLFGEDYVTHYPEGFLPPRIAHDPSQGTSLSQKR